jgi:serine protease
MTRRALITHGKGEAMNRSFHITINEGAGDPRRRATVYAPRRTNGDPGEDVVMPPPIQSGGPGGPSGDPGEDIVMPPPVQSGGPPTNPDSTGGGREAIYAPSPQTGCASAVTVQTCEHACCCGGSPAAGATASTPQAFAAPRDYSGFVIVRLAPGVESLTAESLWDLAQELKLEALQAVLELELPAKAQPGETDSRLQRLASTPEKGQPAKHLESRPLIDLPLRDCECAPGRNRTQTIAAIRELEATARVTAFRPLHSLTAYWRLDLRRHPDLVEDVAAGLNRLAVVDLAYRELTAVDAAAGVAAGYGEALLEDQGYLDDAPVGIGARWAWERLDPSAQPVRICDLEQSWNRGHEAFGPNLEGVLFYGANRADDEVGTDHHGTAVLGQLAASAGSYGVKGAATDVGRFVLTSHYWSKAPSYPFPGTNGHVAAAIVNALVAPLAGGPAALVKGDVLLLEIQRGLLPTEIDEADLDAIRLASALGIIVVEAAGNGGFDLDAYVDPATGRSLRRGAPHFRDSGAILVGAAYAALPHDRAPFSNYGSRLDCFGWGEAVTTCGYGNLAGTVASNYYTNTFSGTSSASPIIAGAAALVQALHQAQTGYRLEPQAMRSVLADPATGTRQGPNVSGFIGIMPDLRAIVRGHLQLVPDVYMRRCIGDDDGSAPGTDEEISSSPDILVWTAQPPGAPSPQPASDRFGEGPRTNHPAPGNPINPEHPNQLYPNNLYVRLRNRGAGEGKARMQLFASPAATLITPERWLPIGSIEVEHIFQGDTLAVSPSLPVSLPQAWPQDASRWPANALPTADVIPAYSFLAVQVPWDASPNLPASLARITGLPPGPPYFDWAEFRSFLRSPGVAWRNVHPIDVRTDMTLPFYIAGTPDRARQFDFEVIQRLPAGAEVILKVPAALAAKLRQRQPWLANGPGDLPLPRRPRTALSQVALAPGVFAHAAFQVKVGSSGLLRGHSLAIRQLWRGEEVGRITWWFVDAQNQ